MTQPDDYLRHQEWHKKFMQAQRDKEKELDDLYLNSLTSIAVVLLIVFVCFALVVSTYVLVQPCINELLANWKFKP